MLKYYYITKERPMTRTSLVVQWLRRHAPSAEGLGLNPAQGTRSHILQPKISSATTKTWHGQIHKWIFKKRNTCDSTIESFTFKSHFTFNWETNCLMACYQKVNTTCYLWNTQPFYSNLINMNLMNQIF